LQVLDEESLKVMRAIESQKVPFCRIEAGIDFSVGSKSIVPAADAAFGQTDMRDRPTAGVKIVKVRVCARGSAAITRLRCISGARERKAGAEAIALLPPYAAPLLHRPAGPATPATHYLSLLMLLVLPVLEQAGILE
jgi:hypothetical protein